MSETLSHPPSMFREAKRVEDKPEKSQSEMVPTFFTTMAALTHEVGANYHQLIEQQANTTITLDEEYKQIQKVHTKVAVDLEVRSKRTETFWQFVNAHNASLNTDEKSILSEKISTQTTNFDESLANQPNALQVEDAQKMHLYLKINGQSGLQRLIDNAKTDRIARGKLKGFNVTTLQQFVDYNTSLRNNVLEKYINEQNIQLEAQSEIEETVTDTKQKARLPNKYIRYLSTLALATALLISQGREYFKSADQPTAQNQQSLDIPAPLPDPFPNTTEPIDQAQAAIANKPEITQAHSTTYDTRPDGAEENWLKARAHREHAETQQYYIPSPAEQQAWVIVDKANPLPPDYAPRLITIRDQGIPVAPGKEYASIHPDAVEDLQQLFANSKAYGLQLVVGSSYRSYDYQKGIKDRNKNNPFVAEPGTSQHQTGYAVDFTGPNIGYGIDASLHFEDTPEGKFLYAHAADFGFVRTYDKDHNHDGIKEESWHFYWVGKPLAKLYSRLQKNGWNGTIYDLQALASSPQALLKRSDGQLHINPHTSETAATTAEYLKDLASVDSEIT